MKNYNFLNENALVRVVKSIYKLGKNPTVNKINQTKNKNVINSIIAKYNKEGYKAFEVDYQKGFIVFGQIDNYGMPCNITTVQVKL